MGLAGMSEVAATMPMMSSSAVMTTAAPAAPSSSRAGGHVSTRRSVLALARAIEPDARTVLRWYDNVGIAELWGRTARQLVETGQGRRVLGFLAEVASGRRD